MIITTPLRQPTIKAMQKAEISIVLKDKKNNTANGTTDKNGMLILPASEHKAYIFGYADGTFRPDNNMSRAEAAAIFARLISEQKGEKKSAVSQALMMYPKTNGITIISAIFQSTVLLKVTQITHSDQMTMLPVRNLLL